MKPKPIDQQPQARHRGEANVHHGRHRAPGLGQRVLRAVRGEQQVPDGAELLRQPDENKAKELLITGWQQRNAFNGLDLTQPVIDAKFTVDDSVEHRDRFEALFGAANVLACLRYYDKVRTDTDDSGKPNRKGWVTVVNYLQQQQVAQDEELHAMASGELARPVEENEGPATLTISIEDKQLVIFGDGTYQFQKTDMATGDELTFDGSTADLVETVAAWPEQDAEPSFPPSDPASDRYKVALGIDLRVLAAGPTDL